MATIDVKDAAGATVALEKPLTPGRSAAATSRPIALSNEDFAVLDGLETALATVNTNLDAIEALLTTQAGYLDGVEALLGTASAQKSLYPSTSSVAITIDLSSLATGSAGVFTAGRESTAIDNTTNLDVDHIVSGKITAGTTPTVSRYINVYAYAAISIAAGTPTYPDVLDGTDSAETFTSANVMNGCVRLLASITVDATSDRVYFIQPTSIKELFGYMPPFWGLYVAHDTAVNLNATGGNHVLHYHRVQGQFT